MQFRMDFAVEGIVLLAENSLQLSWNENPEVTVTIGVIPSQAVCESTPHSEKVCGRAMLHMMPDDAIRSMFASLANMQMPLGSRVTDRDWQWVEADGTVKPGVLIRWNLLPNDMEAFLIDAETTLLRGATSTVELMRWRFGVSLPSRLIRQKALFWSFDGESWHRLGSSSVVYLEFGPELELNTTVCTELTALHSRGAVAPLARSVWEEAWSQRYDNPRSAVVIGVAAAELGFRTLVDGLSPLAGWLVARLQSTDLLRLIWDYLPKLSHRAKVEPVLIFPPKNPRGQLYKFLERGLALRDQLVQADAKRPKSEDVVEILRAVSDLLWIFDYYRGHEWAFQHVRPETRTEWSM